MAFLHSVIGDNTKDNREHLEKLGYDIVNRNDDRTILRTGYPKNNVAISYYDYHLPYLRSYIPTIIDCIGNPQLFKAVSAMRDDSDYMQWFVTEADQAWVNQGMYAPKGSFELCLIKDRYNGKNPIFCSTLVPAHKATLSELQSHFQRV